MEEKIVDKVQSDWNKVMERIQSGYGIGYYNYIRLIVSWNGDVMLEGFNDLYNDYEVIAEGMKTYLRNRN
jgi:hypothetical protein